MKTKLTLLIFAVFTNSLFSQNLVINEILSSNATIITDEDGSFEDWIELYNNDVVAIDLNGYGLSDDATLPFKWTFPSVSLSPGAYLLIWCSDKNRIIPGSPLHTNFKISAGGEAIYLTNSSGSNVETFGAIALLSNISYGRSPNGTGSNFYFNIPTPGASNSTQGYTDILTPPTFSQNGGFYTSDFNLSISTTNVGATILYTLDGSDPSPNNIGGTTYSFKNSYAELVGQTGGPLLQNSFQTLTYNLPIPISDRSSLPNKLASMSSTHHFDPLYIPQNPIFKGSVVRAKAYKPGALDSKIITKSYFITPLGSNRFSLPVVSLSLSENKLFDYNNGIFVAGQKFDLWRTANPTVDADYYNCDANYRLSGSASERSGNLNYFVNGNEIINQDIGIRINGNSTRAWQSKSFRLISSSGYGNATMNYKFFNDKSINVFERLILRNSGNDFFSTMYRDALTHTLVKDLGLETQAYQPTVTFVNGEYWGILNLRERYDNNYFKNVYGIKSDEIDLLEDGMVAEEGDDVFYYSIADYLTNNSLSNSTNFDFIKTQMDVDNIRDYYITNIYFENLDWPGVNTIYWRKRTSAYEPNAPYAHDGLLRAAIKDTDGCFGFVNDTFDHDTLAFATASNGPSYPNPPYSTQFIRSLLENNNFKIDFINRFADLMNSNFSSDRVISVSTSMKNKILPEMQEHLDRWKGTIFSWWEDEINVVHQFASQRPQFQRQHIRQKFEIESNINATLNVSDASQGFIKINTINILPTTPGIPTNPYPWTGVYFHNIPVKITAAAFPGYQFSHWTGASLSTNPEITITSAADFSVTAHFIPSPAGEISKVIYYWMMDESLTSDMPLQNISSTFELNTNALLQYQSCLIGYPFLPANINWRKASMEKGSTTTPLNYIPEANGNITYQNANMKGIQIKQPFKNGALENSLIFNVSTLGYKNIQISFAALDQSAATGISIDYSTSSGAPIWKTEYLTNTSFPITNVYQQITLDFTPVFLANNNPAFKIRIRFTGPNMTADAGNKVNINNVSIQGVETTLNTEVQVVSDYIIYPNPVEDILNVKHKFPLFEYKIYSIEGKMLQSNQTSSEQINLSSLNSGIYFLNLSANGKTEIIKILKK